MRLNVNLKFKDAERKEIVKFAQEIGLGVDEFCKRAVFYAINDAYRRAEEAVANGAGTQLLKEEEDGLRPHDAVLTDLTGNTEQEQFGGSTNSSTLSNETDAVTNS